MIDYKGWVSSGTTGRHAGYDRITGLISWLAVALVIIYLKFPGTLPADCKLLGAACLVFLCYRTLSGLLPLGSEAKRALDLFLLLGFLSLVCRFTGQLDSPFLCLLYLVLIAAALSLAKGLTYLLLAAFTVSYLQMALLHPSPTATSAAARALALLPFLVTVHLAALLARESEKARVEVERLSLTDDLTALNNMRSFDNLARQQEKLSRRYGKPYAICMLDADNLKEINDRHGHLAGTELIRWTASIISQNTRECDIAARFGGDEFMVMFEGHDKEQIRPAVERIVRVMAATPFTFEGNQVQATLSAGIASYPADGSELRSVIMKADEAMYLSKRLGKNRVTLARQEGSRKGKFALQVGREQFGGPVPELHRKTTSVHLGEGDLAGGGKGDGAAFLKDSGKG